MPLLIGHFEKLGGKDKIKLNRKLKQKEWKKRWKREEKYFLNGSVYNIRYCILLKENDEQESEGWRKLRKWWTGKWRMEEIKKMMNRKVEDGGN